MAKTKQEQIDQLRETLEKVQASAEAAAMAHAERILGTTAVQALKFHHAFFDSEGEEAAHWYAYTVDWNLMSPLHMVYLSVDGRVEVESSRLEQPVEMVRERLEADLRIDDAGPELDPLKGGVDDEVDDQERGR